MRKRIDRGSFIKMLHGFTLAEPSFRVWTLTFGDHKSRRTGEGMEFKEYKHYESGEDIADLDVEASLRTGEKLVRMNLTEEKVRCTVILDDSPSLRYYGMRETALLAAGCYIISAVKKKDPICLISNLNNGKQPFISPNIYSAEEAIGLLLDQFDRHVPAVIRRKNTFSEFAREISLSADLANNLAVMVSDLSYSDVFVSYDEAERKYRLRGFGELKHGIDVMLGGRETRDMAVIGVAPYWPDFLALCGYFPVEDSESGATKLVHFDRVKARTFVESQKERENIFLDNLRFLDIPMAWLHSGDNAAEVIEKTFI